MPSSRNRHNQMNRSQQERFPNHPSILAGFGDLLHFAEWLLATGRQPLPPTNDFEVARWRKPDGLSTVVYMNGREELRWLTDSAAEYEQYMAFCQRTGYPNENMLLARKAYLTAEDAEVLNGIDFVRERETANDL